MKKLNYDEFVCDRPDTVYLSMLRSAVIAWTAREYRNPENKQVTEFTCSELLYYIDKNFRKGK